MSTRKSIASVLVIAAAVFGVAVACGNNGSDWQAGGGTGGGDDNPDGGQGASGTGNGGGSANGGGGSNPDEGFDIGKPETDGEFGDKCGGDRLTAKFTPASMLFAIDRTGSMKCNAPPHQSTEQCSNYPDKLVASEPSKWETTTKGMLAAWENLKSFKPTPGVGVLFFNNNDLCGIPDGPAVLVKELTTAHFNALKAEVDKQNAKGETPIIGALMRSYNYFHENAADFEGNRFVVLLTDGSETCDKDNKEFLLEKVELAAAIGIRTFVMGVPGSEGERSFLSQIAKLGETAPEDCSFSATDPTVGNCHMDMTDESLTFADELSKNLEKISLVALSCVIDVPEPKSGETVKPDMVNVIYWEGGVESDDIADGIVPQDYNTECSDPKNQGWQYAPGDQSKIVLCGELCEKVKNDNKAIVAVTLDCPTIVK